MNAAAVCSPPEFLGERSESARRTQLKPGAVVFVIALKQDDGKITSSRVYVEKDGIKPPM